MRQVLRGSIICVPIVLLAAVSLLAQAGAQSASDFYLQYRKAFDAAKKIEDVLPFMSADTTKQIQATPPAERGQMFEMIKMMGALTNVKILSLWRFSLWCCRVLCICCSGLLFRFRRLWSCLFCRFCR